MIYYIVVRRIFRNLVGVKTLLMLKIFMSNEKNHRNLFYFGILFLCLISYGTIISGSPNLFFPYSLPVIIPAFIFGALFQSSVIAIIFTVITVPIIFILSSYPLIRGNKIIPKGTKVTSIFLILFSFLWLIGSWNSGIIYHGKLYTLIIYIYNFIFWMILFLLYKINSKKQSYASNYLFHLLLFLWLEWSAFPWLGELP